MAIKMVRERVGTVKFGTSIAWLCTWLGSVAEPWLTLPTDNRTELMHGHERCLQLDVRNLSLGMRHLVNAYEVEAGTM